MKENITFGIPSNSRIRQDVQPYLEEGIGLKEYKSGLLASDLEGVEVVSLRSVDLLRFLIQRELDIILVGDDMGNEADAEISNMIASAPTYPALMDYRKNTPRIKREWGLEIDQPPQMAVLARKEESEIVQDSIDEWFKDFPEVFTSFPQTLRNISNTEGIPPFKLRKVSGQVEACLRNGIAKGPAVAYDLIRSGKTAGKFDLIPVSACILGTGEDILPSIWTRIDMKGQSIGVRSMVNLLKEKLRRTITLDVDKSI